MQPDGTIESRQLAPGLLLVRSRLHPLQDCREPSSSPHGRAALVITLGLEGRSAFVGRDGNRVDFQPGHTTITSFRHSDGQRCYRGGETLSQLRLVVDEPLLANYLGEASARQLLGNGQLRRLAHRRTSSASLDLARALVRPGQGLLDLHLNGLALLREQLHGLIPTSFAAARSLKSTEVERLERGRDWLLERLEQPVTLALLAVAAGMGESSLKAGWKRHFGCTPQQSLAELRMRRAHALLEGGCQVAQAAWAVGYGHPNNFSVAFARYFGYSPSAVSSGAGDCSRASSLLQGAPRTRSS
ncbi:AraC family transcriptional regulator [Pseudomonas sp. CAN2814]|uniref:AraC family transcriptional regulator n=1 Tax=Pseudomonas sp. CAN1 TaxID=3046726 RepID=UPI0026478065|nr:AraC family transcriptional regulator [Pseudomonas sp. CAN1]MDN6859874.1 AraC family transcriptional regulator [Pseudomonas sp. CAN1]